MNMNRLPILFLQACLFCAFSATSVCAQVYRCQGENGVPEYTNTPRANCARLDALPVTSLPAPQAPATVPGGANTGPSAAPRAAQQGATTGGGASGQAAATAAGLAGVNARIDAATQKSRDADRRRILEEELRREQTRLDELRREFQGGEPERRGDERNYQKYLDRTARLRDDIGRSEGNLNALRREIAALRD
jgi:hypothetical protein